MSSAKAFRVVCLLAILGAGAVSAAFAVPAIVQGQGGARLLLDSGALVDLQRAPGLPRGTTFESATGTDASWIALGSRRTGERQQLVLLAGQGATGTPRVLPAPPSGAPIQAHAIPLLAGRALEGLAWFEGTDQRSFAVKAARYRAGRWTSVRTISPPGPGSQLALTTARLSDGSYALAWSAFDGEDDEILWSRGRVGGGWTAPRPAAEGNRVPDITPALVATGSGVLLAWCRFDGNDYRVVTATLAGERLDHWTAARAVGGPGSVFPTLERSEDAVRLLAKTAVPRGWLAIELDAQGRPMRRAAISTAGTPVADRTDRPRLLPTAAGAVTFRFADLGEDGPDSRRKRADLDLSARWSEEP